jgi:short-subunit dehydrogenase
MLGSSKSIVKVIATGFAKASYSVIINSRDQEELNRITNAEDVSHSVVDTNRVLPRAAAISEKHVCISII